MRQLTAPEHDTMDTYDTCVADVNDLNLRQLYSQNRPVIAQAKADFDRASTTASKANLPRMARGNPTAIVAGGLSKQQLMDLYTSHMAGADGDAREVYDDLLISSGGICPFCGGLGQVWTLDHYLPKAYFPLFSVFPVNLVPCCRDCNSGKNATFGVHPHEQTIHPYLDQAKLFAERWVVAEVTKTDPVVVTYKCEPPAGWSNVEKQRVWHHFEGYKLSYRFGVQARAEVAKVVQIRAGSFKGLSPEAYRDFLLDNANSADFDLNGWSRTMYNALANADWFWRSDFSNPGWLWS